jgi:hypothetical protein
VNDGGEQVVLLVALTFVACRRFQGRKLRRCSTRGEGLTFGWREKGRKSARRSLLSGRVDTFEVVLLRVEGADRDETRVTTGERWSLGVGFAG